MVTKQSTIKKTKMRQIILKALQTNALTAKEIIDYTLKRHPKEIDTLQYKARITAATSTLKGQGFLIYHKGRYRKAGKEVQEWYYNLTGQEVDKIKKIEKLSFTTPSKKELADLYTKYHLNRLNLTPHTTKQI